MSGRAWAFLRALWLALAVVLLAPVSPIVLVGLPLAVLLLAFHHRSYLTLGMAALLVALAFGGRPEHVEPLWYAERGWALLLGGSFVVATLALSRRNVMLRSIGALGAAAAVVFCTALLRPSLVSELDWSMGGEIQRAAGLTIEMLHGLSGADPAMVQKLSGAMYDMVGIETKLYPAFLALGSLAALGVGWYVVTRLAGIREAIGPLREFRFSDQLVWVLIAGLVLFLLPIGELASRLGENAMVFMGGLYLVRGLAVLFWVGAAFITSAWSAALWGLAALLFYPIALGAALLVGLCDTWLDVRTRLRRLWSGGADGSP